MAPYSALIADRAIQELPADADKEAVLAYVQTIHEQLQAAHDSFIAGTWKESRTPIVPTAFSTFHADVKRELISLGASWGEHWWHQATMDAMNELRDRKMEQKQALGMLKYDVRPAVEACRIFLESEAQLEKPNFTRHATFISLAVTSGQRGDEILNHSYTLDSEGRLVVDSLCKKKEAVPFVISLFCDPKAWMAALKVIRVNLNQKALRTKVNQSFHLIPEMGKLKAAYDAHYHGQVAGALTLHKLRDIYVALHVFNSGVDPEFAGTVATRVLGHGSFGHSRYYLSVRIPEEEVAEEEVAAEVAEAAVEGAAEGAEGPEFPDMEGMDTLEPPAKRRKGGFKAEVRAVLADDFSEKVTHSMIKDLVKQWA